MIFGFTKIRDVAEHITVGFVGSMSKYFVENGVPLLRGQNIKPYQLDLTNLKFIPPDIHKKWNKSSLRAGDVVIVRVGYPGTATVIPKNLGDLNAASLVIVRPDANKLDSKYLCYVINSPWGKATINGLLVGAAQQVFNTNTAAELSIPLPPLSTQSKIAAILSAYDDHIENNTRRIKILEEIAQAIYREWFVHFRFPGHEGVRMVESELGLIPEGWEVGKVKNIVTRLPAGNVYTQSDISSEGHIPVIDQSRDEILGYHDNIPDQKASPESPIIIFGDHTCKMQLLIEPFSIGPNVIPFISKNDIPIIYLYHLINDLIETKEYKRHWTELTNKKVVVTSMKNAQLFSGIITPFFEYIRLIRIQNTNLRHTRDLFLPKLISGELDISELDIVIPEAMT